MNKFIILLTIIATLVSCKEIGSTESERFSEFRRVAPTEKVSFSQLQENILVPFGCVRCHASWTATEDGLRSKFIPGEPFSSKLYLKVEDGSMPPGGPQIDSGRLELLEVYIRNF